MPPRPAVPDALATVTAAVPGGGEDRPGQVEMALAVARAIEHGRHLVARAGTGTGKTLAYLLPAILTGRPVVVATATRALQDQLATSDLPLVRRALGAELPVTFAVLKGRANYLCRQRAAEVAGHASWDAFRGADSSRRDAGPGPTDSSRRGGGPGPTDSADPGPTDSAGPGPTDSADTHPAGVWQPAGAGPGPAILALPDPEAAAPAVLPGMGGEAEAGTVPTDGWRSGPEQRRTGRAALRSRGAAADLTAAPAPGGTEPDGLSGGRLAGEVRRLLAWASTTDSGDRAELPFEPHPRSWAAVSVGPRECPGAFRCPSGSSCLAEQARARAASSQVVVVNTALYTAHLAADATVLPPHEVVVFDEAHEVEEIVTRGLGVEVTPGRLRAVVATGRGLVDGQAGAGALQAVADGAARLEQLLAGLSDRRLRLGAGGRADAELADLLVLLRGRLDTLADAVRRRPGASGAPEEADVAPRRQRVLLTMDHLAEDLATLADPAIDQVVWATADGPAAGPVLRAAPVDVGQRLARDLWPSVTGVLTSATVPPGLASRLGLPAAATDHIDVGSPFAYRQSTLLYVPLGIGDRRRPGSERAAHDEMVTLIEAAGGRTLALFTSWRAMTEAAEAVRPRVTVPVLLQGEAPKPALLTRFADDEPTCLFATLSFWQGVDVPGRSASVVVIDRLPFPRPDDPLLQARRERAGDGAFAAVDLPRAATLLAQGVGRLVRRATDRGVVAVLDPRLATARYRGTLLDALPPMRRTVDRDQVVAFLRRITAPERQ